MFSYLISMVGQFRPIAMSLPTAYRSIIRIKVETELFIMLELLREKMGYKYQRRAAKITKSLGNSIGTIQIH